MLTSISFILAITSWLMCINVAFKEKFDKLTMYKDWEFQTLPNFIIWTYILFGIFMFPFYKIIREKRKVQYYKFVIRDYEYWEKSIVPFGLSHKNETEKNEYINCKRYLKLKEIQKKSKKFRIWN